MITLIEAVKKANELVRNNTGIECDPDMVSRVEDEDSKLWWIVYDSSHFFKGKYDEDVIVDGGEYVISVNCQSGEATVEG